MSERYVKKLYKYAKKNYKITLNEALNTVCQENIFHRIAFAFKVIFKIYKIKSKNKIKSKG